MSKNIETFISRYQYGLIALTFGITLVIAFLVGVLFYRQSIVLDNQKAMLQNDAGAKREREKISGTTNSLKAAIYNYKHTK